MDSNRIKSYRCRFSLDVYTHTHRYMDSNRIKCHYLQCGVFEVGFLPLPFQPIDGSLLPRAQQRVGRRRHDLNKREGGRV